MLLHFVLLLLLLVLALAVGAQGALLISDLGHPQFLFGLDFL